MTSKRKKIIITLLILLSVVVFTVRHGKRGSFEEKIFKGDALYSQGDYEESIRVWKQLIGDSNNDAELYEKIGRAFLKLANWNKAKEYFEKARGMTDDGYMLDIEIIQLDILTGDLPSAEKRCLKLKEKIPDAPEFNAVYGDMMFFSGDLKAAEIYYRNAHKSEPTSARYSLKLATCLLAQGRREDADTFFRLAQSLSYNSPKITAQLAEYFILLKEYDKAEEYLKRSLTMMPDDLGLKIRLAQLYFLAGNMEKAEDLLIELVASQKKNISFKKMLADIFISLNRMKEAENIISEIKAEVGHDDPQYNLIQGKYWLFKGDPVYAAAHLKSAVDMVPGFIFARYYLSVAYLAAGQKQLAENSLTKTLMYDPDHTDSQLLMADIFYKKSQFSISQQYINKVMLNKTESYRVYMLKGLNFLSIKEYDSANTEFLKALKLDPKSVSALYYLGVSSELAGRKVDAITYYEKAMTLQSGLSDITYRYVMVLLHSGNTKKAENFIEELIKTHPDHFDLYYIASEVFWKNGNEINSISYLETAISKKRCPAYFYVKLSRIYWNKGKNERAINILKDCLTLHPFNKDAWISIAQLHLETGKMQDAIILLEQAEKKLPYEPEILSNLAWLYLETDSNLDMALEYARSAYEKMPNNTAIADTLGWAYYKKGAFAQASWVLNEILIKEPDNVWILHHLAMSLYSEGKLTKALEIFKKVIQVSQKKTPVSILNTVNKYIKKIENKDTIDDISIETDELNPIDSNEIFKFPEKSIKDDEDILEPQWKKDDNFMNAKQIQQGL